MKDRVIKLKYSGKDPDFMLFTTNAPHKKIREIIRILNEDVVFYCTNDFLDLVRDAGFSIVDTKITTYCW